MADIFMQTKMQMAWFISLEASHTFPGADD